MLCLPAYQETSLEPWSNRPVLENLPGIMSKHVMDETEARALKQARDRRASE